MTSERALRTLCASLALILGCEPHTDPQALATLGEARPQAITYLDDETLVVTDVAYRSGEWGEGRVIFLNPETGSRYGARFTSTANPQRIRASHDQLTLISSGPISLSGAPRGEESTLSVLSRARPLGPTRELTWRATPRGVFAIDVVTSELESLVSSGIDGVLWRVQLPDPENERAISAPRLDALRYTSPETLSLGAVARWGDNTLIIDFNSDRLHILNERGELAACSPELGRIEGVMEGAQTPYVSGGRLWLSFGLSGRLIEVDLNALELDSAQCEPSVTPYTPALGQVPNDLIVTERSIYVLHSAESAIWRYSRASRTRDAVWPLPPQTNPWHFALSPDQSTFAVSEWARGGVTLISASDGAVLRQLDPSALAPPAAPRCMWSEERPEQPPEGLWRVASDEPLELHWRAPSQGLGATRPLDLQGAPQLALAFTARSGPARVEARLGSEEPWVELSPSPTLNSTPRQWRADVDLSELETGAQRSFVVEPMGSLDASTPRDASALADELIMLISAGDLTPCELFKPSLAHRYGVTRLDLSVNTPSPERDLLWGGAHPKAGRVELTALRITSLDLERPAELLAASYRYWGDRP